VFSLEPSKSSNVEALRCLMCTKMKDEISFS
jgi:hypothetical protein